MQLVIKDNEIIACHSDDTIVPKDSYPEAEIKYVPDNTNFKNPVTIPGYTKGSIASIPKNLVLKTPTRIIDGSKITEKIKAELLEANSLEDLKTVLVKILLGSKEVQ